MRARGEVLKAIAVDGARFWIEIRCITHFSRNQLNSALTALYDDRIITKNLDGSYWILSTETVRLYRQYFKKPPVDSDVDKSNRVFVVHGRNVKAREASYTFLCSMGLDPIEFSEAIYQTGKRTPYIGEILDQAFSSAQAIVVLMTPDDLAYLQEPFREPDDQLFETTPTPQARPNVLFEAGMAMGKFPGQTIIIELGNLRPFSDIGGRHTIRLNNSESKRRDLAKRLENAKRPVMLQMEEWKTAGNFETCLETN
jgi:predicted nucleotide-binding protein